jgi:DeoR family transcriptional regulator of aga operon
MSLLAEDGEVRIVNLAQILRISEMTIRRDLEALEMEGMARRVRGGAISSISRSYEPPLQQRELNEHEAKVSIGRAAADLLRDGEIAILDVGTTTLEMARAINRRQTLTIVAASLPIALELGQKPEIRTLVIGGIVRQGELSLIGQSAENFYSDLNCDTVFLGVAGITAEKGLTEYNLEDARVKQVALRAARRCVVLADATKLGKVAFATVADIDVVDILITDASPNHPIIKALEDHDIEVIHVNPNYKESK